MKSIIRSYVQIIVGCFLGALSFHMFFIPNHIAPGGLTGFTTVLNYLFGWPVGVTSLLLNIPLFIIGYKSMGRVFVIRSLFATVLFSLMIDYLPVQAVETSDVLLAAIFGGVLIGIGLGLVLRASATTGGTDMIARMIHTKYSYISVGAVLFFIDCAVVVMAGLFIQIEYALYAFVTLFVCSKVIDAVLMGFSHKKACYIISQQYDRIKQEIITKVDRGVTVLYAAGGYSDEKRPVLLCVLSAQEVGRLKTLVQELDKNAFVFISEAHEVLGEGFSPWQS